MNDIAAKITDLFGEYETVHDETGCLGPIVQLLSPLGPLLVLLGGAEGDLLAAHAVEVEVSRKAAGRLARRLHHRLAPGAMSMLEDASAAGPALAFAVPLEEETRDAFLGGWVRPGEGNQGRLTALGDCLATCGRLARRALIEGHEALTLRKRIEHLLAVRDTLRASHAEAMVATIEEHEKRLQAQEERILLEQSARAAEAANRAKSQFLANMSHEFRTPLHAILSFASFGIKKWQSAPREDLLKYFNKIENSGTVLLALVDDLLDLAKLESGRMEFEFRRVDLGPIIDAAVDEFASMTESRRITITSPPSDEPGSVAGDLAKLLQVLRNLLSNAIKFSPDGATIDVTAVRAGPVVRVSLLDRGLGIPEDELDSVFDKFVQSSKTRTKAGGTGLGLSICREIVAGHRGRIWAENRPGGGAVLTFEIPVDLDNDTAPRRQQADANEHPAADAGSGSVPGFAGPVVSIEHHGIQVTPQIHSSN